MCNTLVIELRNPSDTEGLWLPAFLVDIVHLTEGWLGEYIRTTSA